MSVPKDTEIRQSPLLRLPNEILLMIVEDESLEYDDIRNLGLVSNRLYEITRKPFFQGQDLRVFRAAAGKACVEMMKKCAAYNAAPTDAIWAFHCGTRTYSLVDEHTKKKEIWGFNWDRPVEILLAGYRKGYFLADQCIEALGWFIDNGYQVCEPQWTPDEPSYVPSRLLRSLSEATDREDHQGKCNIIHFLHDNGLILSPTPGPRAPLGRSESSCPASILELHLKQLDKRDMHLTSPINHSKRLRKYPPLSQQRRYEERNPCTYTPINQLVELLFDDLFDPLTWKAEHPLDLAHILDDKISLLVKYQGINDNERGVLRKLVEAMRKIAARHTEKDGLDFERDGVWCWYELCMSISDIMKGGTLRMLSYVGRGNYEEPGDDGEIPRLHEFCATRHWDPANTIAQSRGQMAQAKEEHGDEIDWSINFYIDDTLRTNREWWNKPLQSWYAIHVYWNRSTSRLPSPRNSF